MIGEWWIQEGGCIAFADGEVGEFNHEALVYERCVCDFVSIIGWDYDTEYAMDVCAMRCAYNDWVDSEYNGRDMDEVFEEHWQQVAEHFENAEQAQAMRDVVWGHADGRDYACKYLGWIRVAGNWIQMQTCSRSDLKRLGDGLTEINDEEDLDKFWNINVMANKKVYDDVPIHVLLKGSPTELLQYRRDYQWA